MTFNDPKEEKDPAREDAGSLTEPSVGDLEMCLEFQAGKLGTPAWWEELGAMLDIRISISLPGKLGHHSTFWRSG